MSNPHDKTTERHPRLRYAAIDGYDIEAMTNAVRMTSLPAHGDCRLVWVSTCDLAAMVLDGDAVEVGVPV